MIRWRAARPSSACLRCPPTLAAHSTNRSRSIVSRTASAAAQQAGSPCSVWKEKADTWFITASGPTAAEALAEDDDVRLDPEMLKAVKAAAAAEPDLHLVADEQDAVVPADEFDLAEEAVGRDDHAAVRLDRLEEERHGDRPAKRRMRMTERRRPQEAEKSKSSRPSSEVSRAPRPPTTACRKNYRCDRRESARASRS